MFATITMKVLKDLLIETFSGQDSVELQICREWESHRYQKTCVNLRNSRSEKLCLELGGVQESSSCKVFNI